MQFNTRHRTGAGSTHLHYLPSARGLVIQLALQAGNHRSIRALFYLVFCTNHHFSRRRVPEHQHLLRRKGNHPHRNVAILQYLPGRYLTPVSICMRGYPKTIRTSTCRMSRTLLSLTRPWRRYCSMVAHSTLYVWDTLRSVLGEQDGCSPLPHTTSATPLGRRSSTHPPTRARCIPSTRA